MGEKNKQYALGPHQRQNSEFGVRISFGFRPPEFGFHSDAPPNSEPGIPNHPALTPPLLPEPRLQAAC